MNTHDKYELPAASAERELRRLLACQYAGATLYRDDGELQDNREIPFIDFLRDSPEQISEKMTERGVAQLAELTVADFQALLALAARIESADGEPIPVSVEAASLIRDMLSRYGQPAQPVVPDWPTINDAIAKRFPDDPANAARAQAAISEVLAVPPATGAIPIPKTKEEYIALLDLAIKLGKGLNIAWEDAFSAAKGTHAASAEPVACTPFWQSHDRGLVSRFGPLNTDSVAQEPRQIGKIRIGDKHHPYATLETAYDEYGNHWKGGEAIYAAPVAAQPTIARVPAATVSRKGGSIGSLVWTEAGRMADLPDGTMLYVGHSDRPVAAQPSTDEDTYIIDRMSKLLAEIAVIVRGPEPAGHRHGYADLPERVAALKAAPVAAHPDHSEQDLNMVAQTTGYEEVGSFIWDGGEWRMAAAEYSEDPDVVTLYKRVNVQSELQPPGELPSMPDGYVLVEKTRFLEVLDRPDWRTASNRAELRSMLAPTPPAAGQAQQDADKVDAAFEAVRQQLCRLTRFNFYLGDGFVRREADKSGNWLDFAEVHALFDPVSVDASRARQGGQS